MTSHTTHRTTTIMFFQKITRQYPHFAPLTRLRLPRAPLASLRPLSSPLSPLSPPSSPLLRPLNRLLTQSSLRPQPINLRLNNILPGQRIIPQKTRRRASSPITHAIRTPHGSNGPTVTREIARRFVLLCYERRVLGQRARLSRTRLAGWECCGEGGVSGFC